MLKNQVGNSIDHFISFENYCFIVGASESDEIEI